jgi:hypothetical protein
MAKRRSILDQLEASRRTSVQPQVTPSVSVSPATLRPSEEKKAQNPVPKRRVSVLDEIEMEVPKIRPGKSKLKQKDRTLEF